MHLWSEWSADGLLGGWDQEPGREGGTWLALDKTGRIGFLTNIFVGSGPDKAALGRGFLITDWLKSNISAEEYLNQLSTNEKYYNPFNLVLFEPVNGSYPQYTIDNKDLIIYLPLDITTLHWGLIGK